MFHAILSENRFFWNLGMEIASLPRPNGGPFMSARTLDIILPCYNPPDGWAQEIEISIREIQATFGDEVAITLIIVNDGSLNPLRDSDMTLIEAAVPMLKYLQYVRNRGKGYALRQGLGLAKSEYQIYTDIDFPYTTQSLVAVYYTLARGHSDIAVGTRDSDYYLHVPPIRRFISRFLRWMLRTFLRIKIADTQCGLKGFNADGRHIFAQTHIKRFLFDLEFIFLASSDERIRLEAVPVQLKPGIEFSKARIGILLRESLNFGTIFFRGIGNRIRNTLRKR